MEVDASGEQILSGMENSTRHLLTITLTLTLTGKKTSYFAHSLLCIIIIIIKLIKLGIHESTDGSPVSLRRATILCMHAHLHASTIHILLMSSL